jgi:hypothetical protein
MTFKNFLGALLLLSSSVVDVRAQSDYTPKPGSSERQAICDAAREFVLSKYTTAPLPQTIVFKIDRIRVRDSYCNFEAIPIFKDGSYIGPQYMVDIAFNLCFKRTDNRWNVIVDLSRTDVPDPAELHTIKRNFPPDFPVSLLSPAWRDLVNKSR